MHSKLTALEITNQKHKSQIANEVQRLNGEKIAIKEYGCTMNIPRIIDRVPVDCIKSIIVQFLALIEWTMHVLNTCHILKIERLLLSSLSSSWLFSLHFYITRNSFKREKWEWD